MTELRLGARLFSRLARQTREALPEECCGVLVGSEEDLGVTVVHEVWPTANAAAEPEARYTIPPAALARAHWRARHGGRSVVGYYHSHPRGAPEPSALDHSTAWPGMSYLILAPGRGETRGRSWRLNAGSGAFEPECLVLGDPGDRS